jgi:hypothetical protein
VLVPYTYRKFRGIQSRCTLEILLFLCLLRILTQSLGAKLDRLRADIRGRVDELVDEELDTELELDRLEAARQLVIEKKKGLRQRRLLLKAEYGSLTKREKETMARELASINELSRLEDQAAALGSSEPSASGEPVVHNTLSPPAV